MANESLMTIMSNAVTALREEKSHREHYANVLYISAQNTRGLGDEGARILEEQGKRMHERATELGRIAMALSVELDTLRFGPLQ